MINREQLRSMRERAVCNNLLFRNVTFIFTQNDWGILAFGRIKIDKMMIFKQNHKAGTKIKYKVSFQKLMTRQIFLNFKWESYDIFCP